MADLSNRDALSILQRMDLEIQHRLQERAAVAHVADVIRAFEAAQAGLDRAAAAQAEATQRLTDLQAQYAAEDARLRRDSERFRQEAAAEQVRLKTALAKAREATQVAEAKQATVESEAQATIVRLDAAVREREARLATLQADYDEFRRTHALV